MELKKKWIVDFVYWWVYNSLVIYWFIYKMDLVVLYGKSENGFCVYIEKRKMDLGWKICWLKMDLDTKWICTFWLIFDNWNRFNNCVIWFCILSKTTLQRSWSRYMKTDSCFNGSKMDLNQLKSKFYSVFDISRKKKYIYYWFSIIYIIIYIYIYNIIPLYVIVMTVLVIYVFVFT